MIRYVFERILPMMLVLVRSHSLTTPPATQTTLPIEPTLLLGQTPGLLGEHIDECTFGWDTCDANADCINTHGAFKCICRSGWSGDGITCVDIDECHQGSDNCDVNAECTNTPGAFSCICRAGWSGNGVSCTGLTQDNVNRPNVNERHQNDKLTQSRIKDKEQTCLSSP